VEEKIFLLGCIYILLKKNALVVVISFGLNIYLIKQELGISVLFITILRLWRLFEIGK